MYWDLFRNFFHIGLFTIGGGYAMIPLIQQKVVQQKQWVSEEELVDLMAVAQSCPGIFAVNISIFIGYKLRGVKGALCSTLGACLPSFLIILAIATLFQQFKDNEWVARFFRGIRPAVWPSSPHPSSEWPNRPASPATPYGFLQRQPFSSGWQA